MSQSPSRRPRQNQNRPRSEETLEVVCRIKDTRDLNPCAIAEDNFHVCLIPPPNYVRHGELAQRRVYRFGHVFDYVDSQSVVFKRSCMDLLEELVQGRNALLFAYGVTGSGKTYTMTGDTNNMGILPRAADVLFNSISDLANRCVFFPDGRNGFKMRSEFDAYQEQRKLPRAKFELNKRARESRHTKFFPTNVVAAVFVSYIEIYNDVCYDLLDETLTANNNRANQSKNLRSTVNGQVFVDQLTELEVQSGDEVIVRYMEAEERRKKAETLLNASSSRSHTIFNIRLVMCPKTYLADECTEEPKLVISQLSIVDLAGSERAKRTNNMGDRLAEAAKINQSLFALRKCFEQMRDNQRNGIPSTNVSYRDYKLTHLFKNFFEGGGKIRMIVCVNPSSAEYEENLFVMSFAECAQTIELKPDGDGTSATLALGELTNSQHGRRDVKSWLTEVAPFVDSSNVNVQLTLFTRPIPSFTPSGPNDTDTIRNLREYYEERRAKHLGYLATVSSNATIFEQNLLTKLCDADLSQNKMKEMEKEMDDLTNTNEALFAQKKQIERELNACKKRLLDYENKENTTRRRNDEDRLREERMQARNQQYQHIVQNVISEFIEKPVPTRTRVDAIRRNFQ